MQLPHKEFSCCAVLSRLPGLCPKRVLVEYFHTILLASDEYLPHMLVKCSPLLRTTHFPLLKQSQSPTRGRLTYGALL
jgi:hypothetical protein